MMKTILFIVIAFFVGIAAGMWMLVVIISKNNRSSFKPLNKSALSEHIDSLASDLNKITNQLKEAKFTVSNNLDNIEMISESYENKINNISKSYGELSESYNKLLSLYKDLNNSQTTYPEKKVVQNEYQSQTTSQPVYDEKTTSQPVQQEMQQPVCDQKLNQKPEPASPPAQQTLKKDYIQMSTVFDTVEKLRAKGAEYRVYNPTNNTLEYSNDANSKYIAGRSGQNILVFPNQVDPFAKKQVADNVYNCKPDFVEYENKLIVCIMDDSGNIIRQGKIF